MKKSTLFVLLLVAVFLFMTACNPATKEPAATDDPTSIPGVAEDQNVPSKDKLVAATADDINSILPALSSIATVNPQSSTFELAAKYTYTYNNVEFLRPGSSDNNTVNGSITVQESKPVDSRTYTKIYNGEITVNNVKFTFINFTVANNDTTSYKGECKIDGKLLTADEGKKAIQDMLETISKTAKGEMTAEYGKIISKLEYKAPEVEGNVSAKVTVVDSKTSTILVIVDLKLGKEKIPTTAKYLITIPQEYKDNPSAINLSIEYASFNGVYFTEESLLNAKGLPATLVGFAFSLIG